MNLAGMVYAGSPSFLCLGIRGRSYSNFLTSAVWAPSSESLQVLAIITKRRGPSSRDMHSGMAQ